MKLLFVNKMLVLALMVLILGFSSCNFTETGTVTITVEESFYSILGKVEITKDYYIYMDDVYQGMSIGLVPLTLENIPVGIHTFKASNYSLAADSIILKENEGLAKDSKIKVIPYNCVGSITSEISVGVNYVDIPVFCNFIIM